MSDHNIQVQALIAKSRTYLEKFRRYSLTCFIVFTALLYGFVLFKINALSNQQPSESEITSQVKAAQIPHIDKAVVKQLESLQDNSVSVRALFNEARSNPFQ